MYFYTRSNINCSFIVPLKQITFFCFVKTTLCLGAFILPQGAPVYPFAARALSIFRSHPASPKGSLA